MKKIIMVLGIVTISTLGYVAYASTIASSLVTYSHTGSSVSTVEEALNELYSKSTTSNVISGDLANQTTNTINLGFKPNYLIVIWKHSNQGSTIQEWDFINNTVYETFSSYIRSDYTSSYFDKTILNSSGFSITKWSNNYQNGYYYAWQ